MYIDLDDLKEIDKLAWHSVPDENSGIIKGESYSIGDFNVRLLKNPYTKSGEVLVDILYSFVVLKGKQLILAVNLEREDYRGLADSFGCNVRELQEENKTRSYYGPLRCVVYNAEEKEDQGVYSGDTDLMSVRVFLMEIALDILDVDDELIAIN